jgi:asparagine synthase (glutamine-hydrolysing)
MSAPVGNTARFGVVHPLATASTGSIEVFGSCFAPRSVIDELLKRNDAAGLVTLRGAYALAARIGSLLTLVGSSVAPPNVFYTRVRGNLYYAPTVIDVARKAGLSWRWNWRALADVATLDHCVDQETLHADIRKLGPGEVVRFDGVNVTSWKMPWHERTHCTAASPLRAVDALILACQPYLDREAVVSMSAGFDSRLLLACLLANGVRPRLLSMGQGASTDVRVAETIARRFNLPFCRVSLPLDDYLLAGPEVARTTGGSKTFGHWHTYVYAKNARVARDSRLFVGSNGEAARTYYLDRGAASLSADRVAPQIVKRAFWSVKLRPIFGDAQLALLHPEFAAQFSGADLSARRERLLSLSSGGLLAGLDRFYTEQRVNGFIANGLALLGVHASLATPMLDHEWMAQIWNLPRSWKLDARWHRFAIARLCPELLDFETEKSGRPMRFASGPGYWLPLRRRPAQVPYMDYEQAFRTDTLLRFVREHGAEIAPVARPSLLLQVFEQLAQGKPGIRAASFLLTVLELLTCLRAEGFAVADG